MSLHEAVHCELMQVYRKDVLQQTGFVGMTGIRVRMKMRQVTFTVLTESAQSRCGVEAAWLHTLKSTIVQSPAKQDCSMFEGAATQWRARSLAFSSSQMACFWAQVQMQEIGHTVMPYSSMQA